MKRKLPFGVKILIAIQLLNAGLVVIFIILLSTSDLERDFETIEDLDRFTANLAVDVIYAGLGLMIGYGLFRLHYWAWIAVMLWTGSRMIGNLDLYLDGDPDYLPMLRDVMLVFYLNQHEVQQAFKVES